MKIALLNTSDQNGGAAMACLNLLDALNRWGGKNNSAKLLVREKLTQNPCVINVNTSFFKQKWALATFYLEYLYFTKIEKKKTASPIFSAARLGINAVARHSVVWQADVINIHWINNGFLSLQNLEQLMNLHRPIVFHLHDMWTFTGGCHYAGTCQNYKNECGNCPFLKNNSQNDLSNWVLTRKKNIFAIHKNIAIVAPSQWLSDLAGRSVLFKNCRIETIRNPIDTLKWQATQTKTDAQKSLNLDTSKCYILFGAMNINDTRKGFVYLQKALEILKNETQNTDYELLIFGKADEKTLNDLPLKANYLGLVNDFETLKTIYTAADVFVIPSLEDNLPNTIVEAMCFGVPVVGFEAGGIPEMIDHKQNGYIAKHKSADDLAQGINFVLKHTDYAQISAHARQKACNAYGEQAIAKQYLQLFEQMIQTQQLHTNPSKL